MHVYLTATVLGLFAGGGEIELQSQPYLPMPVDGTYERSPAEPGPDVRLAASAARLRTPEEAPE